MIDSAFAPQPTRCCNLCSALFTVSSEDLAFVRCISPVVNDTCLEIPAPTLCPACRMQRRMAHRNQIHVCLQAEAQSGKRSLSMYFGKPSFPVLSNQEWWAEASWKPEDYGRAYDFSTPFFEQWRALRDSVPRPALNTVLDSMENSDFSNNCGWLKNCYFCFDADRTQHSMYCESIVDSSDCIDCSNIDHCELCFDCAGCVKCYQLQSSTGCSDCSNSHYLLNCRSCRHCFGCVNLRHKQYYLFNAPVSPDQYRQFMAEHCLSSQAIRSALEERVRALWAQAPHPHLVGSRMQECSGNHIHQGKSIQNSFFVYEAEDIAHSQIAKTRVKSCRDCTIATIESELMYESAIVGVNCYRLAFCYNTWINAQELLYCDTCHGSRHCFGCVGMRKREYCILNQQYTREAYFEHLPRIVAHMRQTKEWGEFFPMQHSAWPYNLSLAARHFPLSEAEVHRRGLWWHAPELATSSLPAASSEALPDALPETNAALVVKSTATGRTFRITSEEIRKYRSLDAPLPRLDYEARMHQRALRCGSLSLKPRQCAKTGTLLESVYSAQQAQVLWQKDVFDQEYQ